MQALTYRISTFHRLIQDWINLNKKVYRSSLTNFFMLWFLQHIIHFSRTDRQISLHPESRLIWWNTIPHEKLRLTVHHKKLTLVSHGSFATLASILTCQVNMMYKSVKVMASGDQMARCILYLFHLVSYLQKETQCRPRHGEKRFMFYLCSFQQWEHCCRSFNVKFKCLFAQ